MGIVEHQLRLFQTEVEMATSAFYTWRAVDDEIKRDERLLAVLNETPRVWNTFQSSNRTAFLIALGRIFDTDGDAFSLSAFLNACVDNIHEFSRDALRKRKLRDATGGTQNWLDAYVAGAAEPDVQDFHAIKRASKPLREKYVAIYQPIRHKVLAHRDLQFLEAAEAHFERTDIGHIEAMLEFFHQVESVTFAWLHNGRRTLLRDYTLRADQRYAKEVARLLAALSTGVAAASAATAIPPPQP